MSSRYDRPDARPDEERGLEMRGPEAPTWTCQDCQQRFDLGPATAHFAETGHTIWFKHTPVFEGRY